MNGQPPSPTVAALKKVAWAIAIAGNCFPAVGYFTDIAPPLWPSSGVVTSAIGLAIFALVYRRAGTSPNPHTWAVTWLIGFLVLVVAYVVLFDWTTEPPPLTQNGRASRAQIGFGMTNRFLTREARDAMELAQRNELPMKLDTPAQLMQYFRVWGGKHTASYIWERWTIIVAGCLLLLLFLLAFVAWSAGMAYLLFAL